MDAAQEPLEPAYTYSDEQSLEEKIVAVATRIYGADGVQFSVQARKQLARFEEMGFARLQVCMAKTPYSLSDDPSKRGVPKRFKIKVSEVRLSAGAGFIVPITGEITTMPGLPAIPAAVRMDIDAEGKVKGLF